MSFLSRRRSGSLALEVTLLLPIVIFIFGVATQYFLIAQNRVYVQQAAYAAARSALVHKCLPLDIRSLFDNPLVGISAAGCSDEPQKWEDAARWALIPASPSSEFAPGRQQCPDLPVASAVMAATPMSGNLAEAFRNRLCYAYEPENVEVTVDWERSLLELTQRNARPAMTATVRFKYPLVTPIGFFLADGEREDGTKWRWGEATVTLL